jgi:hypothetical protein
VLGTKGSSTKQEAAMSSLSDRMLHPGVTGTIDSLVSVQEALRSLPGRHRTHLPDTDPGVRMAQELITTTCGIIDDAVGALRTGRDPAGNSIARSHVAAGLQHLVDDWGERITGLMRVVLDDEGLRELQRLGDELGGVAARLRRS